MKEYYRVTFRPRSYFGTVLKSDTIFGVICWAVKHKFGESKLEDMLNEFNDSPPFLISSAMPEGFLPRPIIPSIRRKLEESKIKLKKEIDSIKRLKKIEWIPTVLFNKLQDEYKPDRSRRELENVDIFGIELDEVNITRTAINRKSFTAHTGRLYTESYLSAGMTFNVYLQVFNGAYTGDWLADIFGYISETGIGRDKSVGKGNFIIKIEEVNDEEKSIMNFRGTHFMSMSLCSGSNLEPLSYRTFTKYGKIGDEFSQCGINGKLIISKKPVIFYREGSVFFEGEEPHYGMLVKGVHYDPRIVQYGYAFPVYFNYREQ